MSFSRVRSSSWLASAFNFRYCLLHFLPADNTEWIRIIPGFVNLWIPEVYRIIDTESAWWLCDLLAAESKRNPEWKSVLKFILSESASSGTNSTDNEGQDVDGSENGVSTTQISAGFALEILFGLIDKRLQVVENPNGTSDSEPPV